MFSCVLICRRAVTLLLGTGATNRTRFNRLNQEIHVKKDLLATLPKANYMLVVETDMINEIIDVYSDDHLKHINTL